MYLALKHNLIFCIYRHILLHTDTYKYFKSVSVWDWLLEHWCRLSKRTPGKETFTHYFCTCHPETWWWGWSKWKWQQKWFPYYFPYLTSRYVQVSGQHASQHRGTDFPPLVFSPPRKKDGAGMSPTTVTFPWWWFCIGRYRAGRSLWSYQDYIHGPQQQHMRSNPQLF